MTIGTSHLDQFDAPLKPGRRSLKPVLDLESLYYNEQVVNIHIYIYMFMDIQKYRVKTIFAYINLKSMQYGSSFMYSV